MSQKLAQKLSVKKEFRALGTDIFLEIVLDKTEEGKMAQKDLMEAKKIFFTKENIFSRFDPGSEISRLNSDLEKWQNASPDMIYLAQRTLYYNKISNGLYDPRIIEVLEQIGYDGDFKTRNFSDSQIPPEFSPAKTNLSVDLKIDKEKIFFGRRLDFSGIAKGYIVDRVADFFKKQGWQNFLVDAGGDMNLRGLNCEEKKWRISVEGIPEKKLKLEITNKGIATSGISRKKWTVGGKKFHHLVNPKKPNEYSYELRTVSVIAENAENADGRAKTLVLMGKTAGLAFAKKNNVAAVFLDYKGNIYLSPEVKQYVE